MVAKHFNNGISPQGGGAGLRAQTKYGTFQNYLALNRDAQGICQSAVFSLKNVPFPRGWERQIIMYKINSIAHLAH